MSNEMKDWLNEKETKYQEALNNLDFLTAKIEGEIIHREEIKVLQELIDIYKRPKVRIPKYVPCVCGHNRRNIYYMPNSMKVECKKCGRIVQGKTATDVLKKWNEEMTNES